ncbi:MAG: MBL fold metallo-hydrolase [Succinivibrio sp.]|nr:MBL fold metallo-hydrolase [Succinivibrio sp.]
MKLTMLGTGNALVTKCYNTCFVLEDQGRAVLVDAGGGNQVFRQLELVGLNWMDLHEIIVTHKHVDHVMGIIWFIRMITQYMKSGKYQGEASIYGHAELIDLITDFAYKLYPKKQTDLIGQRLHLIKVEDKEERKLIGHQFQFFDIGSTKVKQFGFTCWLDAQRKLCCCGDEPYNVCEESYARDCEWLLHEAFCLHEDAGIFHPYEKHHSTVKDAAELAAQLKVRNLLLYHTEDSNLAERKRRYTEEAARYFSGKIYVPNDLESIQLD